MHALAERPRAERAGIRPTPRAARILDYFAESYGAARARFRAAARRAGARLESFPHPLEGPEGESLATDIARLGPAGARRLLIAVSGTHGVEGFCGSAMQVGWLREGLGDALPADTAVLLVHALNPYGFAWLRRVNEDNVDLNRNFVDHAGLHPPNPGYAGLRHAICPADWSEASVAALLEELMGYAETHGWAAFQQALSAGQYDDPDGIFFGGHVPTWSNRVLRTILAGHAGAARAIALIDIHAGLGAYGAREIMNAHRAGSPGYDRAYAWYGPEVTSFEAGTCSSAVVSGELLAGVERALPGSAITGIVLEHGTAPLNEVLLAILADNWLHRRGDPRSEQGRSLKAQIRRAFYPDDPDWRVRIWQSGAEIRDRALAGLAAS